MLASLAACRTERIPEPSSNGQAASPASAIPAAPLSAPSFHWKPPLSVPVEERTEAQSRRVTMRYVLDVCAGEADSLRISARDLRAIDVNGTTPSSPVARQVEAASAALPTMVVDARGTFAGVTGLEEMRTRMATDYPEHDLSELKILLANPHAETAFLPALAGRWDTWIGLWRRFAVPGGNPQVVPDARPGASTTLVTYEGPLSSGGARLRGHRVFTDDEVARLEHSLLPSLGLKDARFAGALKHAEVEQDVETDWPDLRPRMAHSRNTGLLRVEGHEQTFVEDHEYRFDWSAAHRDASRCKNPTY
jgi:hypothetical protein